MNEKSANRALLRQLSGALAWAIFIVLAPFEGLLLGAVVWIPIFVWREFVRAKRYGYMSGALYRYTLITFVVAFAAVAPTKLEDKKVGPFPVQVVSLGQLASSGIIYPLRNPSNEVVPISLPSLTPSRREVMNAISQQTQLKVSTFRCGNGATILFGSSGGRIRVVEPVESAAR